MGNVCGTPAVKEAASNDTTSVVLKPGWEAQAQPASKPALEPATPPSTDSDEAQRLKQAAAEGLPYQNRVLGPPIPYCEEDRLATLKALHLDQSMNIEAPPDPEIENILSLVTSIFQAPQALVALFDESRIFIREVSPGGGPNGFQRGDFPWRLSFCAWTMAAEQDQVMIIPDATKDARFCEHPLVKQEGGVRFYVGAPLIASNGHRLGTLCFADIKARQLDANQATILANFAEMVVRHVEKDVALQLRAKESTALSSAYRNLKRAVDCFEQCVVLLDTSSPGGWTIRYTNPAWEKVTGTSRGQLQGTSLSDVLEQAGVGSVPTKAHCEAATAGKAFTLDNVRLRNAWLADNALDNAPPSMTDARGSRGSPVKSPLKKMSTGSRMPSGTRRFVVKLRPAATGPFDKDAVGLALPPWLAAAQGGQDNSLYFMTLELPGEGGGSGLLSGRMSIRSKGSASSSATPVPGLNLGHMLGSGSFGTVYAGSWYGTSVAIKVINHDVRSLAAAGVQMEALLGSELRHPHVVATLTYASHCLDNSTTFTDDTAKESSSSNWGAPTALKKHASAGNGSASGPASAATSGAHVQSSLGGGSGSMGGGNAVEAQLSRASPPAPAMSRLSVPSLPPPNGEAANTVAAGTGVSGSSGGEGGGVNQGLQLQLQQPVKSFKSEAQSTAESNARFPVIDFSDGTGSSFYAQSGDRLWQDFGMSKAFDSLDNNVRPNYQQTWIVLEYCDQGSLQDAIDRGRLRIKNEQGIPTNTPDMGSIISTAHEIASALLYLHSHGIVHGDLSAWNVLLTTSGHNAAMGARGFVAKVADFGLSRCLDFKTRIQTRTYGTITHQPPETLMDGMVSRSTDCYSLGVLLWQMFTGSRPWVGRSHAQIIMAVASRSASLRFPDDVPDDFAALAYSCMSWSADDRPSMEEVCATLNAMKLKYC